jgi:hypothetical protein
MLDRKRIVAICYEQFPDTTVEQIATAADAIVHLDEESDEWEEITDHLAEFGFNASVQCRDICYLAEHWQPGTRIRILRKRRDAPEKLSQP